MVGGGSNKTRQALCRWPGSLPVVYLVTQVGNWGTGNDDVGLIQSTKAPSSRFHHIRARTPHEDHPFNTRHEPVTQLLLAHESDVSSKDAHGETPLGIAHGPLVLWCFVLNPHRRSPYPNSQLELRDKLRVSSPATYKGLAESCTSPPFRFFVVQSSTLPFRLLPPPLPLRGRQRTPWLRAEGVQRKHLYANKGIF